MCGRSAKHSKISVARAASSLPPAISSSGSRLPCTGNSGGQRLGRPDRINGLVEPDRIDAGASDVGRQLSRPNPLGKPITSTSGWRTFKAATIRALGAITPLVELARGEATGPAVEQLHGLGARRDLAGKVLDGDVRDRVDDRLERRPVGIGHRARIVLVAAALTRDHVGSDGPRTAREAQQRLLGRQRGAHPCNGIVDRRQALGHCLEARKRRIDQPRRQLGTFARKERQVLTHGVRHDEDIRKQDRAIEGEAAQRLQRDLGRSLAVVDQRQEAALLGP